MKIRTSNSYSGGPYAWAATDDDCPLVGYGTTREEAIENLKRLREKGEYHENR